MSIEVQTTQNVAIDYEPANMGLRILGYLIDLAIILLWALCCFGFMYFIALLRFFDVFNSESSLIIFSMFVLFPVVFYDLIFETLNKGQSPGKMILKIRVINTNGTTPSFGTYLIRWLFRLVDFSLFNGIVAIVSVAITKNSQRLGDLLAGTTVISLKLDSKSHLQVMHLDYHENYNVTYPNVLDLLSDKDIQTIRSIMDDPKMLGNNYFASKLTQRIKEITGYSYEGADYVFLRMVVSDYNYLALQDL